LDEPIIQYHQVLEQRHLSEKPCLLKQEEKSGYFLNKMHLKINIADSKEHFANGLSKSLFYD